MVTIPNQTTPTQSLLVPGAMVTQPNQTKPNQTQSKLAGAWCNGHPTPSQAALPGLSHFGGKNNRFPLLPHLSDQGLTRQHWLRHSHLHLLQPVWVTVGKGVHDLPDCNAKGAESMQDWSGKSTHGRKFGRDVEGVQIASHSVEGGLVLVCRIA